MNFEIDLNEFMRCQSKRHNHKHTFINNILVQMIDLHGKIKANEIVNQSSFIPFYYIA